jgi:nitrite reductase/ring-hydroxylating ferredoxin subunit/uncharacterized membrane protein
MSIHSTLGQLSSRLERSGRLGAAADWGQALLTRFPRHARVRSALSGTWLGHPVHPFLVATPIGCWTSASILDAVGQPRPARLLVGAGVVSVVPTALTGLSDWADTSGAERKIGMAHLLVNGSATALYALSWMLRGRHHRSGVALSLGGAIAASVGGWLGGHLAYAMGVGVDTNAFDGGTIDWTPTGVEVTGDALVPTRVGATPLVVARTTAGVSAMADRCSHRGGSLSQGTRTGDCVTCPWHGSRFDLRTGEVLEGPAVVDQPCYATRETDGGVAVKRDEVRALRSNTVQVT